MRGLAGVAGLLGIAWATPACTTYLWRGSCDERTRERNALERGLRSVDGVRVAREDTAEGERLHIAVRGTLADGEAREWTADVAVTGDPHYDLDAGLLNNSTLVASTSAGLARSQAALRLAGWPGDPDGYDQGFRTLPAEVPTTELAPAELSPPHGTVHTKWMPPSGQAAAAQSSSDSSPEPQRAGASPEPGRTNPPGPGSAPFEIAGLDAVGAILVAARVADRYESSVADVVLGLPPPSGRKRGARGVDASADRLVRLVLLGAPYEGTTRDDILFWVVAPFTVLIDLALFPFSIPLYFLAKAWEKPMS